MRSFTNREAHGVFACYEYYCYSFYDYCLLSKNGEIIIIIIIFLRVKCFSSRDRAATCTSPVQSSDLF